MRNILILLISSFCVFNSCSDNNCTVDDWTGTYVGTRTCDVVLNNNATEEIEFKISTNILHPLLSANALNVEGLGYILVEECTILGSAPEPGFLPPFPIQGELNGNKIEFKVKSALNTCDWKAKKQ